MATTTSKHPDAHRNVLKLHEIGRRSLREHPEDLGQKRRERLGKQDSISGHLLAFARTLAGRQRGYTRTELTALLTRDHRDNPIVGRYHIILLLRVPREHRRRMEDELLRKRWSVRQFTQKIQEQFGRQRGPGSGRPPATVTSIDSARFALHEVSRRWQRLWQALSEDPRGGRRFRASEFPGPVRETAKAIDRLVAALDMAREAGRPRRP